MNLAILYYKHILGEVKVGGKKFIAIQLSQIGSHSVDNLMTAYRETDLSFLSHLPHPQGYKAAHIVQASGLCF